MVSLPARLALAAVLTLAPAGAQAACRLALLLALDVSSSVDDREYALQRDGLAAALLSEDVQDAILQEGGGSVSLAVYEWSGRRQSTVVQDWVTLSSVADIAAVADRLRAAERSYRRFPTALGHALGFGATMLERGPRCERKVIDVSGDGITNDGYWPQSAYRHFPFDDVTVNGLAVLGADPDVVDHFEFEVLHGPGAFIETSEGYEGSQRAMTRKLYREIQNRIVGGVSGHGRGPG